MLVGFVLCLVLAKAAAYSVCPFHVECIPGCVKLDERGCKTCACGPMMFHPGAGYRGMPGGMMGGSFKPGQMGDGNLFGSFMGGGSHHASAAKPQEKPLKECSGTMLCMMTCKGHYSLSDKVGSNGCRSCTCPKEHHETQTIVVEKPQPKPQVQHVQTVVVQKPVTHPDCTGTKLCMSTCKGKYILGEHGKDGCQSCACVPEPQPARVVHVQEKPKEECHETVLCMLSCKHGYTVSSPCNDGCHDKCQKCECTAPKPQEVLVVEPPPKKLECPKTIECMMNCEHGYQVGQHGPDGCPDCNCLAPAPQKVIVYEVKCPQALSCSRGCSVGYECDHNGCPTCGCIEPKVIGVTTVTEVYTTQSLTCDSALRCAKACGFGYRRGDNGCPVCECCEKVQTGGSSASSSFGGGSSPFGSTSGSSGQGMGTNLSGQGFGPTVDSCGPFGCLPNNNNSGSNAQGSSAGTGQVHQTNTGGLGSSGGMSSAFAPGSGSGSSPFASTANGAGGPLQQFNGGGAGSVSQYGNYNNAQQHGTDNSFGFAQGPFNVNNNGGSGQNGVSGQGPFNVNNNGGVGGQNGVNGQGPFAINNGENAGQAGSGMTSGQGGFPGQNTGNTGPFSGANSGSGSGIGSGSGQYGQGPFSVGTDVGQTGANLGSSGQGQGPFSNGQSGSNLGSYGQRPFSSGQTGLNSGSTGQGPFSGAGQTGGSTGSGGIGQGPFSQLGNNNGTNQGPFASGLGSSWQSGSANGNGWATGGTDGPFANGNGSGQSSGMYHNTNGNGYGMTPTGGIGQTGANLAPGQNAGGPNANAPGTAAGGPFNMASGSGGPASNDSGLPLSPYAAAANGNGSPFSQAAAGSNGAGNGQGNNPYWSGGSYPLNMQAGTLGNGYGANPSHSTDGSGGNLEANVGGYGTGPFVLNSGPNGSGSSVMGGLGSGASNQFGGIQTGQLLSGINTGNQPGVTTTVGNQPSSGTTSGSSSTNIVDTVKHCPDVLKCMTTCENGYNLDTDANGGCPICTCVGGTGSTIGVRPGNGIAQEKATQAPGCKKVFICKQSCKKGYAPDERGCPSCTCVGQSQEYAPLLSAILSRPVECNKEFLCPRACDHGYEADDLGCPTCTCLSDVTNVQPLQPVRPQVSTGVTTMIKQCPSTLQCMSSCDHGYTLGEEGHDGCPACSCINPVTSTCHDTCEKKPAITVHSCDSVVQCMASCSNYQLGATGSDGCPVCTCADSCHTGCEETTHEVVQVVTSTGCESHSCESECTDCGTNTGTEVVQVVSGGSSSGGGSMGGASMGGGASGGSGGAMSGGSGGGMTGGGDQCPPLPPNCHPWCIKYDVAHCRLCECESQSNTGYSG